MEGELLQAPPLASHRRSAALGHRVHQGGTVVDRAAARIAAGLHVSAAPQPNKTMEVGNDYEPAL